MKEEPRPTLSSRETSFSYDSESLASPPIFIEGFSWNEMSSGDSEVAGELEISSIPTDI